ADTDPAESTITSPTAVRNPAEENRRARSTRASRAPSLAPGRRSFGTRRKEGRAGWSPRDARRGFMAPDRRSAIEAHSPSDRAGRDGEPLSPFAVIVELIPARARRREQHHPGSWGQLERRLGRPFDRPRPEHDRETVEHARERVRALAQDDHRCEPARARRGRREILAFRSAPLDHVCIVYAF